MYTTKDNISMVSLTVADILQLHIFKLLLFSQAPEGFPTLSPALQLQMTRILSTGFAVVRC